MTTRRIFTTTSVKRKRSRPLQPQCQTCLVSRSFPIFAFGIVLALSSQATAFSVSSSEINIFDATVERDGICRLFDYTGDEDVADEWEHEKENFDEDEIEEFEEEDEEEYEYYGLEGSEEYYEEEEEYDIESHDVEDEGGFDEDEEEDDDEYDYEEDDLEDEEYWTPEEEEEMDLLYTRYLEEVELTYGANWRKEYELVVDKEEIYVRFLEFEERRKQERKEEQEVANREAEDRRILTEASHHVLLRHEEAKYHGGNDGQNRTGEHAVDFSPSRKQAVSANIPPPRDMIVISNGVSYYNYNTKKEDAVSSGAECSAPRSCISSRKEDTRRLVGSS